MTSSSTADPASGDPHVGGDVGSCNASSPEGCPIAPVLHLFGSQWKHQILWHLVQDDIRFNALRRRLPGITPRTLTRQLRDLERDGLVNREQFSEIPPRVVYSATPLAHSLQDVFEVLNRWGHENMPDVERARARYEEEAQPLPGATPDAAG